MKIENLENEIRERIIKLAKLKGQKVGKNGIIKANIRATYNKKILIDLYYGEGNKEQFIEDLAEEVLREHIDLISIRKAPLLFPKITKEMTDEDKTNLLKKNKEEWKEFSKEVDDSKKRIEGILTKSL